MLLYQQQNLLATYEKATNGQYDLHYNVEDYHNDWHAMHDCMRHDAVSLRNTLNLVRRELVYFETVADEPRVAASLICFATDLGVAFRTCAVEHYVFDFESQSLSIELTRKAYKEIIDSGHLIKEDIKILENITHPDLLEFRRHLVFKRLIGHKNENGTIYYPRAS